MPQQRPKLTECPNCKRKFQPSFGIPLKSDQPAAQPDIFFCSFRCIEEWAVREGLIAPLTNA